MSDEPGRDRDAPTDDPFQAMATVLGEAAVNAVQALRQSTALIDLLIAKGLLTREEVDQQMRSTEELTKNLEALSARMTGERPTKTVE